MVIKEFAILPSLTSIHTIYVQKTNVLPGFNLSLGYTLLYLSLIVLIPLSAAFIKTTEFSFGRVLAGGHSATRGGLLQTHVWCFTHRCFYQCHLRAVNGLGIGALRLF